MNQLIRRVAGASARRPWLTIVAWGFVCALTLALAGLSGNSFADDMVAPGSQSETASTLLRERFPQAANGTAVAVFAAPDGQRLDRYRSDIEAAVGRMETARHVAAVAEPFAAGTVSSDGRIGYATIAFDLPVEQVGPDIFDPLDDELQPVRLAGAEARLGGDAPFLNSDPPTSGGEAAGLLVALIVLVVALGAVVAALLPIALALVAVAAGMGGIVLLAGAMDVSSAAPTVAAMVGLGVGIDYALLIVARYRENRAAGQDNPTALANAVASSGTAVLFAGGTVVVAMCALVLTGMSVLGSIGLATSLVVSLAVAAALTLLPALLSLLGDRVDAGRLPGRRRRARPVDQTIWWRFAHRVSGRPWPYLILAVLVLLTLAAPASQMRTGFPDAGDGGPNASYRRAYDLLAEGFGPGINAPLLLVVDLRGPGTGRDGIDGLARRVDADPGIVSVGEPQLSPARDTVVLVAYPTTAPADPATSRTLARVRDLVPDNVAVSGLTAMADDLTAQLDHALPIFVVAILVVSVLLLMVVFRSVVVPLKAAVVNLLSIGGAYGVVVAVFQWGWLRELFGLDGTYLIASPLPAIFFAILYGLSTDYEVFLLSRVREEYDATGDNTEAVARGMAGTGRVITAAALIMTAVFLGFVANPEPTVKMMGLGIAAAILIDATIVRMVLVPATMALLGRANWWLPRWLDRVLPRVSGA